MYIIYPFFNLHNFFRNNPEKKLPNLGQFDTIYEDLPFPTNEPYEVDVYFDLPPIPLDKKDSTSDKSKAVRTIYVNYIISFLVY